MAEFCKKCFIEINKIPEDQEFKIVLSNVKDFCERCGNYDYFVRYFEDSKKRMTCQKDRVTLCENAYIKVCGKCGIV